MLWRGWFQHRRAEEAGARARRLHETWLTGAMRAPKRYPRIPVRRVDLGGFGPMLARPEGRSRAEAWWSAALDRVDNPPTEDASG